MTHPFITTELFAIPETATGFSQNGGARIGETYLVYAPLRRVAFVTNAATVNALARLREVDDHPLSPAETDLLAFCERLGLTGPGDLPVAGLERSEFKPVEVTLFLTTRCNLRCIYCYADAGRTPPVSMALQTARRGIDFTCQNALELGKAEFGVGYHGGGEPVMHWEVLTRSFEYARVLAKEKGLGVYGSMATNGVLTAAQRDWVIRNFKGVNVSMDGLAQVQDRQRPRPGGLPSSGAVNQTLHAFDAAGYPYGVRLTVTADSVDQLPAGIAGLLEHHRPRYIQVEPVYLLGRGRQASLAVDPAAFISAYRQAAAIARQAGVDFYFSAVRLDTLIDRFCQSCGEGFSLTPQGLVSACYEVPGPEVEFAPHFLFGHFDEFQNRYVFEDEKLALLRRHNVRLIPWCRNCFVKWHCAGDCLYKSQHARRDGEFAGDPRCEITRALTLDQILARIRENGGIFWAGDNR